MASGFVQRWKGKVNADSFWLKGWGVSETNGTLLPTPGSTLSQNAANYNLSASSGAVVYTLGPVDPGVPVKLALTAVSSAIFIKAAAGNNFGVFGGSTMIVMKSTSIMTIAIVGVSSIAWAVESIWSTSTTVIPQPTFSTTT